MLRDTILVTGHKSPDTDSICSAISYANLNVSPCSCESFVVDPRLAVLRTLLKEENDD